MDMPINKRRNVLTHAQVIRDEFASAWGGGAVNLWASTVGGGLKEKIQNADLIKSI